MRTGFKFFCLFVFVFKFSIYSTTTTTKINQKDILLEQRVRGGGVIKITSPPGCKSSNTFFVALMQTIQIHASMFSTTYTTIASFKNNHALPHSKLSEKTGGSRIKCTNDRQGLDKIHVS